VLKTISTNVEKTLTTLALQNISTKVEKTLALLIISTVVECSSTTLTLFEGTSLHLRIYCTFIKLQVVFPCQYRRDHASTVNIHSTNYTYSVYFLSFTIKDLLYHILSGFPGYVYPIVLKNSGDRFRAWEPSIHYYYY
jgi:hypothetical protein